MTPTRLVPSDANLIAWREEGLTARQIIDRHYERTGVLVRPGSIYSALSRIGATDRKRYDDVIPWRVRSEHESAYPLVMLRVAARARRREVVSFDKARKFVRWAEHLYRNGLVVDYDPETGWRYVPARPGVDTGYIREAA